MTIIIGLGNPGPKYSKTRHNIGFMAIDKIVQKNNFPEFELDKKSNALLSRQDKTILAKPQTFMNNSGKTAQVLAKKHGAKSKNFIILHDDSDLPVGKIKIVEERGSAGHKGVESIIKAIGNKNLIRIRIGIGPAIAKASATKAKKIVLKNFSKKEQEAINKTLKKTTQAIGLLIKEGIDKAMNEYNK